jgi:hypothetical protein
MNALCAAEAVGMSKEQLQHPDFLRGIAQTIFERTRERTRLKEKLCKHSPTIIEVWASGKKWGELDPALQEALTKSVPKSQIQSILRRERHTQMAPEILENPDEIARLIMERGDPVLVITGEKEDGYAIKISLDVSPTIVGTTFLKTEAGIQKVSQTKIYISFNATGIITMLMKDRNARWDQDMDGEISTLCADE